MHVLIVGLNYSPEPIGIGPFTAGVAGAFAAAGFAVDVVTAQPYYPQWRPATGFAWRPFARKVEDGVSVRRVPIYIPRRPTGLRRLLHYASFCVTGLIGVAATMRRRRPDVVMVVVPSLLSTIFARLAARLCSAKLWIHVQDFEVEAAAATGLLTRPAVLKFAMALERWLLRADLVSTISPQMRAGLIRKGVPAHRCVELRNWADIDAVRPLISRSPLAATLGITTPYVALYSGNLARKQGIEIIAEAARFLAQRHDLTILVCGNGPMREALDREAAALPNLRVIDLRPREDLPALLGLATVHVLPQLADAADLVLPSKLANMLASGRPVVATAAPGTGLADEVAGCGVVTPPGEAIAFARAIESLVDDPERREALGCAARARAEERWGRPAILRQFTERLRMLAQRKNPRS